MKNLRCVTTFFFTMIVVSPYLLFSWLGAALRYGCRFCRVVPDISGETGLMVAENNPTALADAVLDLIWLAGKKRVEAEFDPRQRVYVVIDMFHSVLGNHA